MVGHVHEALAERGQLGALLVAHTLLQLGEHRPHILEERRSLQDVEYAADGEQAEPFALGDRDGRGGTLVDQRRDHAAVPAGDLDVEAGVLELGEVAAHGPLAHADLGSNFGHPAPALVPAEGIEHPQRARDLAILTALVHAMPPRKDASIHEEKPARKASRRLPAGLSERLPGRF